MFVVKRNGQKQPVQFDKITARIVKLCYGLNTDFVDPILVAQKVTAGTPLIAIFISSLPIVFTVPLSACLHSANACFSRAVPAMVCSRLCCFPWPNAPTQLPVQYMTTFICLICVVCRSLPWCDYFRAGRACRRDGSVVDSHPPRLRCTCSSYRHLQPPQEHGEVLFGDCRQIVQPHEPSFWYGTLFQQSRSASVRPRSVADAI